MSLLKVINRERLLALPIAVAMACGLAVAANVANPEAALAKGKIKCADNLQPIIKKVDPIVNHNQAAAMHNHQFFGSVAFLKALANPNTANYNDVQGRPTNCRVSADTAGYWTPTLQYTSGPNAGKVLPVQQFTAYYRAHGVKDFGPGRAYPADTRLVGSNVFKQGYNWTCGQFSKQYAQQGPVAAIPDCSAEDGSPGNTLTAHIFLPSCWNGKLPNHSPGEVGDTRDNRDYAYASNNGRGTCPAGFPIEMVHVNETIQFQYTGSGNDIGLSSDKHSGVTDGRSMHGDFWNTWTSQATFEKFVHDCVNVQSAYTKTKCDP
jgi:hypothetical protein